MPDSLCALVVDDNPRFRDFVASLIRSAGFVVVDADDGQAAIPLLGTRAIDLLVTDVSMPLVGGLDLTRIARSVRPALPIIVVSADPTCEHAALSAGADAFLWKLSADFNSELCRWALCLAESLSTSHAGARDEQR